MLAASKGLGRAAAEALAAEGVSLVVSSSDRVRCEAAAREIADKQRSRVIAFSADMMEPASMDALFAAAEEALGGVDILVLNHPGPSLGLARDLDPEQLEPQFRMMIASPLRLIVRALPGMRKRGWGRILAIGGAALVTPLPNKVMDNTFRPALAGYAKALANEVAGEGITVNMVLPGTFMSDRVHHSTASNAALWGISVEEAMQRRLENIPTGRFGELEEFGAFVAFLCSERARYVNGSVLRVDGSQTRSTY